MRASVRHCCAVQLVTRPLSKRTHDDGCFQTNRPNPETVLSFLFYSTKYVQRTAVSTGRYIISYDTSRIFCFPFASKRWIFLVAQFWLSLLKIENSSSKHHQKLFCVFIVLVVVYFLFLFFWSHSSGVWVLVCEHSYLYV